MFELSADNKKKIDHWLTKYPPEQKRSAIVAALLYAQEQNHGWLSDEAMNAVANYLGLAHIEAYEVATFYDMFELQPVGKHLIRVCTNVPCMLRGSEQIVKCLHERLGVGLGETSADGKFTLREAECMAACANAPMCQVDDKAYHVDLTPEKMLAIINELDKGAS